jgi:hypothetical protein
LGALSETETLSFARDEDGDISIEAGRILLGFRQVDLSAGCISLALDSDLAFFDGELDTSSSAMGFGCASEPSPITAISPDSCLTSFPVDLGESFDQKAQVDPALGVD